MRLNNKNELVIPFSNGRGEIRSYQRIPVTGGKDARILKDSEKTGNWFTFGTRKMAAPCYLRKVTLLPPPCTKQPAFRF